MKFSGYVLNGTRTSDYILGVIWITVWIHKKYIGSDPDHYLDLVDP